MFSKYFEETNAVDVAQGTSSMGTLTKCTGELDCKCDKCNIKLTESPVGTVGRTGSVDAETHITDKLRAEFKKMVIKLGGKTVARKLLSEMNTGK